MKQILFTLFNQGAGAITYFFLESGGILIPFIIFGVMTIFNGIVLVNWEEWS